MQYARYADPAYVPQSPQSRIAAAFVQAARTTAAERASQVPAWARPEPARSGPGHSEPTREGGTGA